MTVFLHGRAEESPIQTVLPVPLQPASTPSGLCTLLASHSSRYSNSNSRDSDTHLKDRAPHVPFPAENRPSPSSGSRVLTRGFSFPKETTEIQHGHPMNGRARQMPTRRAA